MHVPKTFLLKKTETAELNLSSTDSVFLFIFFYIFFYVFLNFIYYNTGGTYTVQTIHEITIIYFQ